MTTPTLTELTVADVTLRKHDGGDYHYYRAAIEGQPVDVRPTLGSNGRPLGWRVYVGQQITGGPSCIATGESLTLAVQRAKYSLRLRQETRKEITR